MDKLSYALGMSVGLNLQSDGVKEIEFNDFLEGVKDTIKSGGEVKMKPSEAQKVLNKFFNELDTQLKAEAMAKEEKYLKENADKEGVQTTKSGLQYKVLVEGDGKQPGPHSRVKCHYAGRLIDGTEFDSSYKRGEPATFGLDQVIPGWTEGLQLMKVGSKYEFTLPAELGYGERGIPGHIPGNSVLNFVVELLDVE